MDREAALVYFAIFKAYRTSTKPTPFRFDRHRAPGCKPCHIDDRESRFDLGRGGIRRVCIGRVFFFRVSNIEQSVFLGLS